MTKWNGANATLVQATLQALPQLGFSQVMPGLQAAAVEQHARFLLAALSGHLVGLGVG